MILKKQGDYERCLDICTRIDVDVVADSERGITLGDIFHYVQRQVKTPSQRNEIKAKLLTDELKLNALLARARPMLLETLSNIWLNDVNAVIDVLLAHDRQLARDFLGYAISFPLSQTCFHSELLICSICRQIMMKREDIVSPPELHLVYVTLLLENDDESALFSYLTSREDYPLDEVAALCQKSGLIACKAFLLERAGDFVAAIASLNSLIVTFQVSEGDGELAVLQKIKALALNVDLALALCLRASDNPALQGSTEDAPVVQMWLSLFNAAAVVVSRQPPAFIESHSTLSATFSRVFREAINCVPAGPLVDYICSLNLDQTIGEFKSVMVEAVKQLRTKVSFLTAVGAVQSLDLKESKVRKEQEAICAITSRVVECMVCGSTLEHAFNVKNAANTLIQPEPSLTAAFRCGHAFHVSCLPVSTLALSPKLFRFASQMLC